MTGTLGIVTSRRAVASSLCSLHDWVVNSVYERNDGTFRFVYQKRLEVDTSGHEDMIPEVRKCPVRDIGTAWNTALLLGFLSHQTWAPDPTSAGSGVLLAAVRNTIDAYGSDVVEFQSDESALPCARLNSAALLGEAPAIVHSAFLTLGLLAEQRLIKRKDWNGLCLVKRLMNGVVSQQDHETGAVAVLFGRKDKNSVNFGIELYPAESLLSLVDVAKYIVEEAKRKGAAEKHEWGDVRRYLQCVSDAFPFYAKFFHEEFLPRVDVGGDGRERERESVNFFANWQVHAFAEYVQLLLDIDELVRAGLHAHVSALPCPFSVVEGLERRCGEMAAYVKELSLHVARSRCFQGLGRRLKRRRSSKGEGDVAMLQEGAGGAHVERLSQDFATVEVACGLEALIFAWRLQARLRRGTGSVGEFGGEGGSTLMTSLRASAGVGVGLMTGADKEIESAIESGVQYLLEVQKKEEPGKGGFGHSLHHHSQRIDVTCHVASAFMQLYGCLPEN
uniref:Uncharacterized protein n=1 Tax=Chromera velia CCMP2878 TaxID=1169474 RepID=A0A0G4HTA2_9ALVE|eukprot:Cvel_8426.t1-p1 / transcript=Cvel_8426.t1 / gene=Cvel_8426 / organism=Chromera_velia_CCMP2878 / gene_product=hypothetical protein / transcript_product=hypothetical protein / location=Cvel_scaffold465:48097-49605(+) / protein_length=503 / sequence_SO=supercontig / SO=protein_coding / is_pseudo=false